MFDAHCHLHFEAFDGDRKAVVAAAARAGLRGLLMAGYDRRRRSLSASLAEEAGVFATAGVHPWAVATMDDGEIDKAILQLEADLDTGRFVGLGELGLDFFRVKDDEGRQRQERAFRRQLGIAREQNLPVVIHAVKCHNSLLKILREEGLPEKGGMMHGYSGSSRQVGNFLMLNLDISIGTPITFDPPPKSLPEVVHQVPLDRLMVETDAPDRPPQGHRGERNELVYLEEILNEVAAIKKCDATRLAMITERNVRARFELGDEVLGQTTLGLGD